MAPIGKFIDHSPMYNLELMAGELFVYLGKPWFHFQTNVYCYVFKTVSRL